MSDSFDVDVLVVGGGGCGLVAAIAASRFGSSVALVEKSHKLGGHTLATSAMVPAAGTRWQAAKGVRDTPEIMIQDIMRQNAGLSDKEQVKTLCRTSSSLIEWLNDECGIRIELVLDFNYTGHSNFRMHTTPNRTGSDLISGLTKELDSLGNIFVLYNRPAVDLLSENGAVIGARFLSGDHFEEIRAKKIVIATSGFGANRNLKAKYIPDAAEMAYWGSGTHTGEAILWGERFEAELQYMDSYQAHSAVSSVGTLINWVTMLSGGIMVNSLGKRFADETMSYSSFANFLFGQPGQKGYEIYDEAIHQQMLERFEEYRQTVSLGGITRSESIVELSKRLEMDVRMLKKTIENYNHVIELGMIDEFGRTKFKRLEPPFFSTRVTPALFHTQGGLRVNPNAQVLKKDGSVVRNVYAGGGAAAGISGSGATGYLTGNGLLSALCYGFIAGRHCALN